MSVSCCLAPFTKYLEAGSKAYRYFVFKIQIKSFTVMFSSQRAVNVSGEYAWKADERSGVIIQDARSWRAFRCGSE